MIKFSKMSAITTASGYFSCPSRRDEKSPPNYRHLNIIILAGHPLKFFVFYLVPLDVSSVEQRSILFCGAVVGKKTKVKLVKTHLSTPVHFFTAEDAHALSLNANLHPTLEHYLSPFVTSRNWFLNYLCEQVTCLGKCQAPVASVTLIPATYVIFFSFPCPSDECAYLFDFCSSLAMFK